MQCRAVAWHARSAFAPLAAGIELAPETVFDAGFKIAVAQPRHPAVRRAFGQRLRQRDDVLPLGFQQRGRYLIAEPPLFRGSIVSICQPLLGQYEEPLAHDGAGIGVPQGVIQSQGILRADPLQKPGIIDAAEQQGTENSREKGVG